MNTKSRLQQFIETEGISGRRFSEIIGASSNYFNVSKTIGSEYLEKIADAFPNLDMHWVITGKERLTVMPDKYNFLGDNLKHIRINLNLTSNVFSQKLGISTDELVKYETGVEIVPSIVVAKVCKFFLNTSAKSFYTNRYTSFPLSDPDDKEEEVNQSLHLSNDNNANWKEKYYELMERYMTLLEEINRLKNTG